MKKFYIWLVLAVTFFAGSLTITTVAQTSEKETEKRFELVFVACGEGTVSFYKTPDSRRVKLTSWKQKNAEEAKNKIESLVSDAIEIIEANTYFRKNENQTGAYYILRFEDNEDKTHSYKIVKFINENIQIITASTMELALEFEKWQIIQK